MKIDAVIFDKDGTLLDFDAFWVTVSQYAIKDVLRKAGREDISVLEILEAFGVYNGRTDIEGVLCKGTYEEMGCIVHDILQAKGSYTDCAEIVKMVVEAYNKNADTGQIRPTCPELIQVLAGLKKQDIKLALVTTDNEMITRKCLQALGIEDMFDRIYTDDGVTPPKPDPYCASDFSCCSGVPTERMLMVGDTMTDVKFAKNAGISVVGLTVTERNRVVLEPHVNAVIGSLTELADLLK